MFTSKHKGICWDKTRNKWVARIWNRNKCVNLGRFETEDDALEAYNKYIIDNFNNLSNKTKNFIKINPYLPRDGDGFIDRVCVDCGKIDKYKKYPYRKRCKDCGIKFRSKKIDNFNQIVNGYNNGLSLRDLGKKYNINHDTIRGRLIKNNTIRRDRKYCLSKANDKIIELCKTGEFQKKTSARQQGIAIDDWKDFIIKKHILLYKSSEYRLWRRYILTRDNFECQICNKSMVNWDLHAHHIKKKSIYPQLIFNLDNGITLCKFCHWKHVNGHEQEYEQFFLDILNSHKISV